MDVRVDGGPQDGTILVTWIPATNVSIAAKMAPVTGYAVFADGKRVTDVDSPTSRHSSSPGFIFVQHLRGFLGQFFHLDICFLSTLRQMPQTITNIPRCLPQILTLPKFWYHLAHSFSWKNVPFDFEMAF